MLDTFAHATIEPGSRLRLSAVDWRTYSRYLKMFADCPGVRLTYDHGELEIMSPPLHHDFDSRSLGYLIGMLTKEYGLPLLPGGSTSMSSSTGFADA